MTDWSPQDAASRASMGAVGMVTACRAREMLLMRTAFREAGADDLHSAEFLLSVALAIWLGIAVEELAQLRGMSADQIVQDYALRMLNTPWDQMGKT